MKRMTVVRTLSIVAVAAAMAGGAVAQTRTNTPPERFSYTVVNADKADGPARYDIIINRWSSEAERDRLLASLNEGVDKLAAPLNAIDTVGHIKWPGMTEYSVKYAYRVPRADGSEDIVLATDRPVFVWWDTDKAKAATTSAFSVLQLRLNKDGRGEGKLSLSTKIAADKTARTIVVDDFANEPTVLTDVQRG